MRIAVICDNAFTETGRTVHAWGYFSTLVWERLQPMVTRVTVFGRFRPWDGSPQWLEIPRRPWLDFHLLRAPFGPIRTVVWLAALFPRFLRELRSYDVILIKIFSLTGIVAWVAACLLRKPILVQIVGDPARAFVGRFHEVLWPPITQLGGRFLACLTRTMVRTAQAVWVVSDELSRSYVGRRRPYVVASESKLTEGVYWRRDRTAGDPPRLLFVGRLERVKGIFILVQAIAVLAKHGKAATLTIVGDGSLREEVLELVVKLGLRELVEFRGYVGFGPSLFALYREADVLVLPSYSEGLPLVVLEAMANSLPVVATRVGGIPSVVEDWYNGRLVAPGDPEALAQAITDVVADEKNFRRMSQAAYETALAWSAEGEANKVATLFLKVLRNLQNKMSYMSQQ